MTTAENKTESSSLLFLGDIFGGVEESYAYLVAHHLILLYPEIDFTFWFSLEENSTVQKIHKESFRTIISRYPTRIVAVIGYSDLQNALPAEEFSNHTNLLIREITSKCHKQLLISSPPPLAFTADPMRMVLAEEYDSALAQICKNYGVYHLRLSGPFNEFIKGVANHQGTIFALHKSDGTLTPFGMSFLAHQILKSDLLDFNRDTRSLLDL